MRQKSYDHKIIFIEGTLEDMRNYIVKNFDYNDIFKAFRMQDKLQIRVKDKFGNKWDFINRYLYRDQISLSFSRAGEDFLSRRMTHDEFFDLFIEW